jgi:hypothetical protein
VGLEFVLVALIMPLAQRLGDRWLDAVAQYIDDRMRRLLRQLVVARAEPDREARQRQTREAQSALMAYVGEQPAAEAQLVQVAKPQVAVTPDVGPALARLEQYHAILTFVFDRVAALGHPVALPGFFNSTLCVTVVDARPRGGTYISYPNSPEASDSQGLAPRIFLGDDNEWRTASANMPRLWLLRSDSPDERDTRVAELTDLFSRHEVPRPGSLEESLGDSPKLVRDIEANWVRIEPPVIHPPGPPSETIEDRVERIFERASKPRAPEDPFYDITADTKGIELLLASLHRQLQARWDADQEWRRIAADVVAAA